MSLFGGFIVQVQCRPFWVTTGLPPKSWRGAYVEKWLLPAESRQPDRSSTGPLARNSAQTEDQIFDLIDLWSLLHLAIHKLKLKLVLVLEADHYTIHMFLCAAILVMEMIYLASGKYVRLGYFVSMFL